MTPIDLDAQHIDQIKRTETGLQRPDVGEHLPTLAGQAWTTPTHVLKYNQRVSA